MPHTVANSPPPRPFATAYRRLSAALADVDLRDREPAASPRSDRPGFLDITNLDTTNLTEPGVLDALLTERLRWLALRYHDQPRPDVAATSALYRYLWLMGLAIGGPYLLTHRVPLPDAGQLRVAGDLSGVTLLGQRFACLPDDPLAAPPDAAHQLTAHPDVAHLDVAHPDTAHPDTAHPDVHVVPDLPALRHALRTVMAAQATPVLDAFAGYLHRGAAARRTVLTDQLAAALWSVGRALGDEERCVTEAQAVLRGTSHPYRGGTDFRRLDLPDGRRVLTRTRGICCLYYTLAGQPPCITCPRLTDTQRIERLTDL